jgi:hypothetical protein
MNEQITQKDIETVLNGILINARDELISKTRSQLEDYWYFQYDAAKSKEWNLYQFTKALDLYKSNCRRWEEHHNGNSCVVERVRDQYLMPKITQFIKDMV